mmetsp:Transcript_6190/g.12594  ORF Transcript_6190/g.12594 Transcript_6190/m.12594 type:complete len:349 (-) Transcript_6190:102-1148(-)|eukprot:CAMPEP_0118942308 /NCGR_PEP_ID=MMETSP1169-20130426/35946_1 /TAXON_ID=36882 /ORGANISM="Pyramimonas obovata, Strain CCMP722" /LENGTH=348 /DNA_ID=CAMNT_0006887313 /DNA_START=95 /DNA_END=1141 /DNA_ORIENTATION=-
MPRGEVSPYLDLGKNTRDSIRGIFAKQLSPTGADVGGKENIAVAAQAVAKEATKIGILWKEISTIDELSARSSLEAMVVACIGLHSYCENYYRLMGPTLSEAVHSALVRVGDASATLVEAVTASNCKQRDEDLPQLVGVVWEKCKAMERLPKDNRAAVGRALARTATVMKDIVREINEIDTDVLDEEGEDNKDTTEKDEEDFADLDFDADFEKEELRVVAAAKPLFPAVVGVVRSMVRELAEGLEPANEEELAAIEEALESAKRMMVAAEGLGASLYPPQDTEELQKYRDEVTREVLSAKAALGGRQTPSDGDSKLSSDGPLEASATDVQLLCAALGTALTLADEGEV